MIFQVSGKGAWNAFKHESGGHRFQRVPPTEKRGRVQTSTITIAVLPLPHEPEVKLKDCDLEWKGLRGSGKGGQHRNVTDSAVQLFHKPTGIMVRAEAERSQKQNLDTAKAILSAKLKETETSALQLSRNGNRKAQLGGGARGDKRRSIALQRDQVVDHVLGKRMSAAKYMKGELEGLYGIA